MAQAQATKEDMSEQTNGNGSNGGGAGRTAVRAAAIAAVSGATALAAKKAFVDRGGSGGDKPERSRQKGEGSDVFGSMVSSAWDSARDSLVPMLEDAASSAGEYLAQNGPEIVRETIVPRFIDGFERGRGSSSDD
ncbi:MAG: hypothetical protein E6G50_11060 [Actinobacteria bacterium]|nr:MAG: hypothetical protein E6G50_11060 [Actinomycetota bacterium]